MLKCNQNQYIYIVCPAGVKTGGTELLHQLAYELNKLKLNAWVTYTEHIDNACPNAFQQYVREYKFLDDIQDRKDNILVLPEVEIKYIFTYKEIKKVVWWLSVDNYLKYASFSDAYRIRGIKGLLGYFRRGAWLKKEYPARKIARLAEYNLAQSYYAFDYLKKNGFRNIGYLSDYINQQYLRENNGHERQNIVLFNPAKGKAFTRKLMNLDKSIRWKPLINMTNEQVKEALLNSKVYVDFGNHPGKDRFPREAAACGCCVITGKRGAAAFYKDVSIPDEYKFDERKKSSKLKAIRKIHDCFDNYELRIKDFEIYKSMILKEPEKFEKDVKTIFLG